MILLSVVLTQLSVTLSAQRVCRGTCRRTECLEAEAELLLEGGAPVTRVERVRLRAALQRAVRQRLDRNLQHATLLAAVGGHVRALRGRRPGRRGTSALGPKKYVQNAYETLKFLVTLKCSHHVKG